MQLHLFKIRKMKKLLSLLNVLLVMNSYGQQYQWKSAIEVVNEDGFYKVDLQPTVLSKLQPSFADIKIKGQEGKEVPYFLEKEPFSVDKRVFKAYKIIKKQRWKNGATVLVVENKEKDNINNIQLQIKNFDVTKRLELSGSDNKNDWYTIKENYFFYAANGGKTTSEIKSLHFPYTDYRYYRIVIYDVYSMPINVLKIGYYDTYQELGKFKKLPKLQLSQFDSAETKQTYVKVVFDDTPYWDKLTLKVTKPTYFFRNATICIQKQDKKGRFYYERINRLTLNSNEELTFYHTDFPHQEFYIVIENEDNPPLEGIQIEAYQLNRYLVAHLEKQNNYQLVFGNDQVRNKPNYDIAHFKNKVGEDIPLLKTAAIFKIMASKKEKIAGSALWIWLSIGFVVILLGYISYKMINEMEKK